MSTEASSTRTIAVSPPEQLPARRRLLTAIESAYPVRFEPFREGSRPDGLIGFGMAPGASGPALLFSDASPEEGTDRAIVDLSGASDERLHACPLEDGHLALAPGLAPERGDQVAATAGGKPVWTLRDGKGGGTEVVMGRLPELQPGEALRDRLRAGRFFSLLPLVDFVRRLTDNGGWRAPDLRAQFMFDDPNLHWPSYGYIRYAELVERARAGGFHVAIAMIPLDAWFAHRRAVGLFRDNPAALSLLMHGVLHEGPELMRPLSPSMIRALIAQALRRVERFERQSGLGVARIMVAPHGFASEDWIRAQLELGLEAQFSDWPFPWRPDGPPADWTLAGWEGAQFVAGGFPILPRHGIFLSPEELVLRAYLDLPLVVYGHHGDVRDGYERLEAIAGLVNRFGPVKWRSADRIARSSFATRRDGGRLTVRLLSRCVDVEVPDGVARLCVDLPPVHGEGPALQLTVGGSRVPVQPSPEGTRSEGFPVTPGRVTVRLETAVPASTELSNPRPRVKPIARRLATELRDRVSAIVLR